MSSKNIQQANTGMQPLLETLKKNLEKIYLGGGKKAIEKQKEKIKLTARERINYLIDKESTLLRLALLQVMKCMKNMADALQAERLRCWLCKRKTMCDCCQ